MSSSARSPKHSINEAAQAEAERESKAAESERQFASQTLKREVNWSGYEKNGFINKKELGMLLDYDKQKTQDQNDLLLEKGADYAAVFVKSIDAIRAKDTVEYLVLLIDQLLTNDSARSVYFLALLSQDIDPFGPLLRILSSSEQGYHPYILTRTSAIIGQLLCEATINGNRSNNESINAAVQLYLKYTLSKLQNSSIQPRELNGQLNALKLFLLSEYNQKSFIRHDGLKIVTNLINRDSSSTTNTLNAQLIYNVGFNLWLLSYNASYSQLILDSGILKKIVYLLKTSAMEKCARINVALIKNLLSHSIHDINEFLIGLGLIGIVETLTKRKFKDVDINSDLDFIQNELQSTITRLSTFDQYHSEVMSGNLQWTPVHKNEIFWRENIGQFEHKNYEIVAKLIELLGDEDDAIREIACYDLGEFARFSPEGKRVVVKLGGKNKLMLNLAHKNPKVAKAALLATQKIMVANWEYLAKSSSGGVAALVSQKQAAAK